MPPPIPLAPKGSAKRPFQVKVEVSREPITDSVLSYAGTKDPLSGVTWGGVVRTGGDGLVSYDDGLLGMYVGGGGGAIDGKNVANNTEFDGIVGGFIRPYRSGDDSFKIGVNLTYFTYDKNLSFFTLGQGGYFSPQNYLNVGVPMEYSGATGASHIWSAALSVSKPSTKTGAPSSRQMRPTRRRCRPPARRSFNNSRSVTGPSFGIRGQLEYQLNNGFSVGALASVDNAEDYTEAIGKIYLRKVFGVTPTPTPAPILPTIRPGSL